jgi:hypothetical protein
VAATGPFVQGDLRAYFTRLAGGNALEGFRTAGLVMCSIFLLGLFVLPFAPETKDQPLPE